MRIAPHVWTDLESTAQGTHKTRSYYSKRLLNSSLGKMDSLKRWRQILPFVSHSWLRPRESIGDSQ